MSKKFKTGDVVSVKSSSLPMTVIADEDDEGFVQVTWLDAHGKRNKPEDGFFPADALVVHQPADDS